MQFRPTVPGLLSLLLALAAPPTVGRAMDNAGVYVRNATVLDEETLRKLAPGAEVSAEVMEDSLVFHAEWDDLAVRIAQQLEWDQDKQVAGLRGYLGRFSSSEQEREEVQELTRKLDLVVDCLGTQITPAYDSEGRAANLVVALARLSEGFIFSHQSLYDADGRWVIGQTGDPRRLGPAVARAEPAPSTPPPAIPTNVPPAGLQRAPFSAEEEALLEDIERRYRIVGLGEADAARAVDAMRTAWVQAPPSQRLPLMRQTLEQLGGTPRITVPEESLKGKARTRLDSPEPTPEQLQRKERSVAAVEQMGLPVLDSLPVIEAESSIRPRSPQEVAQRCLGTTFCSIKAETGNQERVELLIAEYDASGLFSPQELNFVYDPSPSPEDQTLFGWRYEAMHVLLWALGHIEDLNPPSEICDVAKDVVKIRQAGPDRFVPAARMRPMAEILDMADLYYRLHWAAVQLRIEGKRDEAVNESIVYERHRALNWLIRYMNQEWDDVAADT